MKPFRLALIGYGAIGRMVADRLDHGDDPRIVAVLVRPGRAEEVAAALPRGAVAVETLADLLGAAPDLVLECAGQDALRAYGVDVLDAGCDLMVIATGALAEPAIRAAFEAAAEAGGSRLLVPAGAIAGLDGLGALKIGGLDRVRYISAKPPHAWRGTAAERILDLAAIDRRTIFFSGSADEAALTFPQNANLACTVALAGAGFAATTVDLVADPALTGNCGRIEATGAFGTLTVELSGPAMPGNPKTSAITALSLVRALRNRASRMVI